MCGSRTATEPGLEHRSQSYPGGTPVFLSGVSVPDLCTCNAVSHRYRGAGRRIAHPLQVNHKAAVPHLLVEEESSVARTELLLLPALPERA